MDEHVYPGRGGRTRSRCATSGDPHFHPPVMEELKAEARDRGLWNLFHPHHGVGPGPDATSSTRRWPRSWAASPSSRPRRATAAAPDTGNMEVLTLFGTAEQQGALAAAAARRRDPLGVRDDRARRGVSSDATNIELRIERDGDDYVLNGRKWWTSNALHPNCRVLIVMGKTDPDAPAAPPAVDAPGAARHARRDDRAQPARLRLPGPRGPRRDPLRGRAGAGHRTCSATRATAS